MRTQKSVYVFFAYFCVFCVFCIFCRLFLFCIFCIFCIFLFNWPTFDLKGFHLSDDESLNEFGQSPEHVNQARALSSLNAPVQHPPSLSVPSFNFDFHDCMRKQEEPLHLFFVAWITCMHTSHKNLFVLWVNAPEDRTGTCIFYVFAVFLMY